MLNSVKGALYAHRIALFFVIVILGGFVIGFQENSWDMAKKIFFIILMAAYILLPSTAMLLTITSAIDKEWDIFKIFIFYLISVCATLPLHKLIWANEGVIPIEVLLLAAVVLPLLGAIGLIWAYKKIENL